MKEKRQCKRIRFDAKCSLSHNNINYLGRLENISLNGALISFNEGLIIPKDEKCFLTIYIEGIKAPLRSDVTVIHSNFTMVGIKFTSKSEMLKAALENLIDRLTSKDEHRINEKTLLTYKESEG